MHAPTDAKPWTPDQLQFQAWLALPPSAREPRAQKDLAKQLERDAATLSDWKKLPGFHDAVYELAVRHVVGELVPVLYAQVKQAKDGSLPHAQWLFEIAGKWSPKQRHEHSGELEHRMTVDAVSEFVRGALGRRRTEPR